jgi:hypothetical protein
VPEVRYHLTAADLRTIAEGIRLRPAEPPGILELLAAARHEDLETCAGTLFMAALLARPCGGDSAIFALEAARVLLYANGMRIGQADISRALTLVAAVEAGEIEDAAEIGKRLVALDR